MFGKDAFLEVEDTEDVKVIPISSVRRSGKPSEVFDGPSHTLPPVGLLFDAFMEEILVPKGGMVSQGVDGRSGIRYDKGLSMTVEELAGSAQAQVKVVTDEDMQELEGFFRQVLSTGEFFMKSYLCV
jgi:NET1-associated nuclear protein 1 (U3 small nucleolar RNA-associated protein 17)